MSPDVLDAYVARTLADAPPIGDEQRERITRLLRPGARAHAEAGGRR